jgi:hypothetical protein
MSNAEILELCERHGVAYKKSMTKATLCALLRSAQSEEKRQGRKKTPSPEMKPLVRNKHPHITAHKSGVKRCAPGRGKGIMSKKEIFAYLTKRGISYKKSWNKAKLCKIAGL